MGLGATVLRVDTHHVEDKFVVEFDSGAARAAGKLADVRGCTASCS